MVMSFSQISFKAKLIKPKAVLINGILDQMQEVFLMVGLKMEILRKAILPKVMANSSIFTDFAFFSLFLISFFDLDLLKTDKFFDKKL